ncbi:hypothetical protein C84B14_00240 [Salinisphaera sp. C84B14]|uniref:hypothetical protein n=1 Tax=Salinisphaera sp. C84B14 TaxID=1304155 RepID=UPI00333ED084
MNIRIVALTCVLLGFAGTALAERAITGSQRAITGSDRAISGSERAIGGDSGTPGSGNMSVIDGGDRRTNLGISGSTGYSNGVTNSNAARANSLETRRSQFESDSRPLSDKIEQRRRAFEGSSD